MYAKIFFEQLKSVGLWDIYGLLQCYDVPEDLLPVPESGAAQLSPHVA